MSNWSGGILQRDRRAIPISGQIARGDAQKFSWRRTVVFQSASIDAACRSSHSTGILRISPGCGGGYFLDFLSGCSRCIDIAGAGHASAAILFHACPSKPVGLRIAVSNPPRSHALAPSFAGISFAISLSHFCSDRFGIAASSGLQHRQHR